MDRAWVDTKKELASIIELTGEMPEQEEGFKATKEGNQYELQWNDAYAAMKNAKECQERMKVTPLTLKYANGQQARILRNPNNGTIMLIDERFLDIIDNGVVQYGKGELPAEGPLIQGKMIGAFWKNETMALHVCPRKDEENKMLIAYLEMFDPKRLDRAGDIGKIAKLNTYPGENDEH